MFKARMRRARREAFTLIEVLLVMVILVALVSLGAVQYTRIQKDALKKNAKIQIGAFETALNAYSLDVRQFPSSAQGLESLRTATGDLRNPDRWAGPYFSKSVPLDPWDQPYQYAYPGQRNPDSFDLWSLGPDGQDGTGDEVGNWSES